MILIGGRIYGIFWPLEMSNFDKPRAVSQWEYDSGM